MPGVTHLKMFVSRSNSLQSVQNFFSAVWMAGIICSKFFVSCLNGWHHPSKIFRSPFKWLASSVQNFLLAIWTAGITGPKFLVRRPNGWHHQFEIKFFVSCLNGWHHPSKIFRSLFKWLASSIQNFLLAVWTVSVTHPKFFIHRSHG